MRVWTVKRAVPRPTPVKRRAICAPPVASRTPRAKRSARRALRVLRAPSSLVVLILRAGAVRNAERASSNQLPAIMTPRARAVRLGASRRPQEAPPARYAPVGYSSPMRVPPIASRAVRAQQVSNAAVAAAAPQGSVRAVLLGAPSRRWVNGTQSARSAAQGRCRQTSRRRRAPRVSRTRSRLLPARSGA